MRITSRNGRDRSPLAPFAAAATRGVGRLHWVAAAVACACRSAAERGTIPVCGSVTCGDEKVPTGKVSFVPVENTRGPVRGALIVDGRYRIDSQGGVPWGKYRVEVDARKKTGRKVQASNGREMTTIDEEVRTGAEAYAGARSPLVIEVCNDSSGQFDIAIPKQ